MISTSNSTVVGLFQDERTARDVVQDLTQSGFSRDSIHFNASDYTGDVASGGAALTGRAPEAHGGGFMGWLKSVFGGDEHYNDEHYKEDMPRYAHAVQGGRHVVAVNIDDNRREEVVEIMNAHDAIDIDRHAAEQGFTVPGTAATEGSIPVVNEELKVGKRAVQRGGVRIYSHVVERPVEDVQLREEKVNVERHPVDRPVTDADLNALRDQTIEVTETIEEPVIEKRARVVEEIRIGKQTTERTERVSDTVRRTEVNTERIGASDQAAYSGVTGYDQDFRSHFQTRYGTSGETYETYEPAYQYGYRMAGDPRYQGQEWNTIEPTLRTDYSSRNPGSTWDRMKDAVQYGWEKVSGRR